MAYDSAKDLQRHIQRRNSLTLHTVSLPQKRTLNLGIGAIFLVALATGVISVAAPGAVARSTTKNATNKSSTSVTVTVNDNTEAITEQDNISYDKTITDNHGQTKVAISVDHNSDVQVTGSNANHEEEYMD